MKNRITDLRDHLFETLEALKDEKKPMELDRAKAIADVARVIVDSAKAEVQYLNASERALRTGTGFIPVSETPTSPEGRRLSAVAGGQPRT